MRLYDCLLPCCSPSSHQRHARAPSSSHLFHRCNRLQVLSEFDSTKRTCAVALAAHNARRRVAAANTTAATAAPSGRSPSASALASGGLSTSAGGEDGTGSDVGREQPFPPSSDVADLHGLGSWLNDNDASFPFGMGSDTFQADDDMAPEAPPGATLGVFTVGTGPSSASPDALPNREAMVAIARAVADAAAAHGCTLHIKLPEIHNPSGLSGAALRGMADELLPGPLPATMAIRPGCVLLTLDALVPAEAVRIRRKRSDTAEAMADDGTRYVPRTAQKAADVVARASLGVDVTAHGSVVMMRSGGQAGQAHVSASTLDSTRDASYPPLAAGPHSMAVAPQLAGAAPGALVPGDDDVVTLRLPALASADATTTVTLHGRVDGHTLRLTVVPDGDMSTVMTSLPAGCAPDGAVILIEVQESSPVANGHPDRPAVRLSRCMPVLLCVDAAAVAQVNAWCAIAAAVAPDELTVVDALDTTLRLLGAAMRADAPLAVRVSAAKACTAMNWDAMLRHLLTACVTGDGSTRVRGALILACSQQLCVTPGAAACAAVLGQLCTVTWATHGAATATAMRLLRHASDVECHTNALCATLAAADAAAALKDDAGAGEVLSCMSLLISDGSLAVCLEPVAAVTSSAAQSAGDADAAQRYATFCLVRNYSHNLVVAALRIAAGSTNWRHVWHHVLSRPGVHLYDRRADLGPAKAHMLSSVRLHPFRHLAAAGAQPFPIEQVYWPRVLPAARAFVASEVLVRLPMDIALAVLVARHLATASARARLVAQPELGARVALLIHILSIGDALMHVVNDVLASWAGGWALPEWPVSLNLLHALGLMVAFGACLHPGRWMFHGAVARFASAFGVMLVFVPDALHIMFFNIGYLAQLVAILTGALLIPRRDAAARAQWLASEAAATAASKGL